MLASKQQYQMKNEVEQYSYASFDQIEQKPKIENNSFRLIKNKIKVKHSSTY